MASILSTTDLRKKKETDLHKLLKETRREAFERLINLRTGQESGRHVYRQLKQQIARIITVLNEFKRK